MAGDGFDEYGSLLRTHFGQTVRLPRGLKGGITLLKFP